MAIIKRKKERRFILCGSSTKVLSPRQTKCRSSPPTFPRSGATSPTDGKQKMGLFDRIRVFFARYRERLRMRRKMKRLARKISDDPSLIKPLSVVKVPSLSVIMESPEVKDALSQNGIHLDKKTSLKGLYEEVDSIENTKNQNCHDNKENSVSPEGSTSDFNDILNDDVLIDSNKCSSAVIPSKAEARRNNHSYEPLKNEIPFEKEIKATSVWESENKSKDRYSISSIESIEVATDYPNSSSSEEVVFEKRNNQIRSIVRKNRKDAFLDQKDQEDEENREVRKMKSNTKRVHFNLDPVTEPMTGAYAKTPMVPEQYYKEKSQEKLSDNRMKNVTEPITGAYAKTPMVPEQYYKEKSQEKLADNRMKNVTEPITGAYAGTPKVPEQYYMDKSQEKLADNRMKNVTEPITDAYAKTPMVLEQYYKEKGQEKLADKRMKNVTEPITGAYAKTPMVPEQYYKEKSQEKFADNRMENVTEPITGAYAKTPKVPEQCYMEKSQEKLADGKMEIVKEPMTGAYAKTPMVPEQNYMDKSQEKLANNRMNNAQKRHEFSTSESSSSSTDSETDLVRSKRDRSLDAKVHPAVAKKLQSKPRTNTMRTSSFEQYKPVENSTVDAKIPSSNKVKVIKMEETEKSLYDIKTESKNNADEDADLIREIERFAKNIVHNATTGGLERAEKVSTAKNDRYSASKSSFSLFDDGTSPQKNLMKEILSQVKGPNYLVPNLKNDDEMCTYEGKPTAEERKDELRKLDAYFGSLDDSFDKVEYETSDCESDDMDFARMDDLPKSRQPMPKNSDVSGWDKDNKDENIAEFLTCYTAHLAGDESMPVYSKESVYHAHKKPDSGQIVIHDPNHFNRNPISYPPPTPKAPSLPPNPFPVNKRNLPNVYNPKKGDYEDYTESKKKKKSGKKSHRKDKGSELPVCVESTQELGLLKEVTNRWVPTPSVFLGKKGQEPEDIYIKQRQNEPLLPIAGSRTSPVSNDVLFPNAAKNVQMPNPQVYTQPMGKLSSKGRDSSGIDISCFTGGYPPQPPETERKKGKNRHRKHKDNKYDDSYPTVAKDNMDLYRKMQTTFKARETEVPDAKFWIDLNKGKYELKHENRLETRAKPKRSKPKKAWEATSKQGQTNSSSNSSKDQLPDEMNPKEPLSPIGSNMPKHISHDQAKENFHYFKAAAAADRDEVKRLEDMQTDKRVLQKFNSVKKPLKPIEDVLPEEKASHAENMHFFKNITTTPVFWSDTVVPQEKKPKRYIPKKPLDPIPTNSPESPSSPAENMEFFKTVAQYPKGFYETDETNQYPKEHPYFTEAPIGSTKENAGRCHCRENENLEFFRYISSNQDVFQDLGESSPIQEAVWKKNRPYSPDESSYVDPITAEENMRFFREVSKNPSDFYKTNASEEALSQAPRRRKPSIIEDDPRNYVDAGTAEENMEFFKKHAKKSKKGKKKNL